MEVKIFLTADYANIDRSGKINILGVFTQIHARTLPLMLPQMHVIVQLAFDWSESKQHRVMFIRLFDPDGHELATIPNEFDVPDAKYGQTVQVNALAGIQNFTFTKIGGYEFKLFMGDNYVTSVGVDVKDFSQFPEQPTEG